jgi:hypothetical protein
LTGKERVAHLLARYPLARPQTTGYSVSVGIVELAGTGHRRVTRSHDPRGWGLSAYVPSARASRRAGVEEFF